MSDKEINDLWDALSKLENKLGGRIDAMGTDISSIAQNVAIMAERLKSSDLTPGKSPHCIFQDSQIENLKKSALHQEEVEERVRKLETKLWIVAGWAAGAGSTVGLLAPKLLDMFLNV